MNEKEKCNLAGNALLLMMGVQNTQDKRKNQYFVKRFSPCGRTGVAGKRQGCLGLKLQRKFEKTIRSVCRGGRIAFCG